MKLIADQLNNVSRCPHCSVATPSLKRIFISSNLVQRATPGPKYGWAVFACSTCGGCILVRGEPNSYNGSTYVQKMFPTPQEAHEDIPVTARTYLQQAYETLHAPDAAAVMAGSAVDAMLKEHGYIDGSVYTRINQAVEKHLLTEAMGEWAHSVRLGSNRPRHADAENPHVSPDEARQSVEFAEALGHFLFVLTARIQRGIDAAQQDK